jgi:hypothetical protein
MDSYRREVDSERDGSYVTLTNSQPTYNPFRGQSFVGGTVAHFLRNFFGAGYFYEDIPMFPKGLWEADDMTGPIIEDLCPSGTLPERLLDAYYGSYPTFDNVWPQLECSVKFDK